MEARASGGANRLNFSDLGTAIWLLATRTAELRELRTNGLPSSLGLRSIEDLLDRGIILDAMAFRDRTLDRIDPRVRDLIQTFSACLDAFDKENLFTGPSLYFHAKTRHILDRCRAVINCAPQAVAECIEDESFLESLYATLTAWGLHRMGPGNAKLVEFRQFTQAFRQRKDAICELSSVRIDDLADDQVKRVAAQIWRLVAGLEIGLGEARIVRGSKALHHFLPDLVPPIDRAYTLKFFFHVNTFDQEKEQVCFMAAYPWFRTIAIQCRREVARRLSADSGWDTSITKVIDNAIVGYVRKHPEV